MFKREDTNTKRLKRHIRVRAKIFGTPSRPRLSVYRSNDNINVQIIDDTTGNTLVAASSYEKEIGTGGNKEAAKKVGMLIAQRARKGNNRSQLTEAATLPRSVMELQPVPVKPDSFRRY